MLTARAGVRVLVVENELRRAMARVFGRAGHTVIEAADRQAALDVVDSSTID